MVKEKCQFRLEQTLRASIRMLLVWIRVRRFLKNVNSLKKTHNVLNKLKNLVTIYFHFRCLLRGNIKTHRFMQKEHTIKFITEIISFS